jgi:hypothetical protein
MFPSAKIRFTAAARRGFELAVEFATLGEYRLPPAQEQVAVPAPQGAAFAAAEASLAGGTLGSGGGHERRTARLRPATAAARRLQPAAAPRRISERAGVRALALSADEPLVSRGRRKRAGAAKPQPQPCLVSDAGAARMARG